MAAHAEYKAPGGKLVVVDVEVSGDTIARVELSGDFFLEPPEALDDIVAALAGQSIDSDVAELSEVIHERLGEGVEFIGFSPEAVAIAVCRALEADTPRERL